MDSPLSRLTQQAARRKDYIEQNFEESEWSRLADAATIPVNLLDLEALLLDHRSALEKLEQILGSRKSPTIRRLAREGIDRQRIRHALGGEE